MSKQRIFPKDFYWGASTASHQVEGGTVNQWSVWELAHAKQLANTAEQRLSAFLPNWDQIKKQAQNPSNYVSGKGVDHYNLYKEDFDIAKKLNLNSFRFGIEWSRLEPEEGKWDEKEIEHYRQYIAELKERNIEPFLNVWHWTMPVWFDELGGFTKRKNLKYFYRFVQKIADEYGSELKYIISLNEPNVFTIFGYMTGEWPPQQHSFFSAFSVYRNLVKAHKKSYKIFKKTSPHLQIGIAQQLGNIQAKRPHNFFDQTATKIMRYSWNWWFLNRIRKYQDFVGFNYYFTDYYRGLVFKKSNNYLQPRTQVLPLTQRENPKAPLNDVGDYMEPEGLYPLLVRTWARYHKPIFITENGVPDANDQYRQWWLQESIIAMERAVSEGVDIMGYFHWSLLDNFEWAFGWWPKYGLVEVDRKNNMKRKIRASGHWYAKFIETQR